jgi:hypothetical protein
MSSPTHRSHHCCLNRGVTRPTVSFRSLCKPEESLASIREIRMEGGTGGEARLSNFWIMPREIRSHCYREPQKRAGSLWESAATAAPPRAVSGAQLSPRPRYLRLTLPFTHHACRVADDSHESTLRPDMTLARLAAGGLTRGRLPRACRRLFRAFRWATAGPRAGRA